MASRELLRVEGVDASYLTSDGQSIQAVDHVSLTVNDGRSTGHRG